MREAKLSDAAIGAFKQNYDQLVAGVTGLVRSRGSGPRGSGQAKGTALEVKHAQAARDVSSGASRQRTLARRQQRRLLPTDRGRPRCRLPHKAGLQRAAAPGAMHVP